MIYPTYIDPPREDRPQELYEYPQMAVELTRLAKTVTACMACLNVITI
jgi:hypothetical protein